MAGPASEFSSDCISINSRNKSGRETPAIDSPTTHVQSFSFVKSDLQCCLKLSECLYSRAYKSKYLIRNYCKTYSAVTGPVCVEIYGHKISRRSFDEIMAPVKETLRRQQFFGCCYLFWRGERKTFSGIFPHPDLE